MTLKLIIINHHCGMYIEKRIELQEVELETTVGDEELKSILQLEQNRFLKDRDSYNGGTRLHFSLPKELEIKVKNLILSEMKNSLQM